MIRQAAWGRRRCCGSTAFISWMATGMSPFVAWTLHRVRPSCHLRSRCHHLISTLTCLMISLCTV
jgi:hypothetical protein